MCQPEPGAAATAAAATGAVAGAAAAAAAAEAPAPLPVAVAAGMEGPSDPPSPPHPAAAAAVVVDDGGSGSGSGKHLPMSPTHTQPAPVLLPAADGDGEGDEQSAGGAAGGGTSLYTEADKAERLSLCGCGRVETTAFHLATWSFFVAFFAWFAVAPLLPAIRESLHLTARQVQYSNLASIGTTIVARVLVGPLVDYYGPKVSMTALLLVGAVPFLFAPLVSGFGGLVALRACIGILGASFVVTQAWTTAMFRRSIVGRANALAAGWGNLGGGTSQLLMVELYQALLPNSDAATTSNSSSSSDNKWRLALLFPAGLLVLAALAVYLLGTDTPRGDVAALKRKGEVAPSPKASLAAAASDYITWILALQYAVSFGVELVALNTAASYFHERLGVPPVPAGRLATYGGASNLFTRPLGGWASDRANRRWGAKGRLGVQFALVLLQGAFLLRFAAARTTGAAAAYLLLASAFIQAANGSCFALVPYLSEQSGGAVAGIVSSGGNFGSIVYTLMFAEGRFADPSHGFAVMGWVALACAPSVWLIRPRRLEEGHRQRGKGKGPRQRRQVGEGEGEERGETRVVVTVTGQ